MNKNAPAHERRGGKNGYNERHNYTIHRHERAQFFGLNEIIERFPEASRPELQRWAESLAAPSAIRRA